LLHRGGADRRRRRRRTPAWGRESKGQLRRGAPGAGLGRRRAAQAAADGLASRPGRGAQGRRQGRAGRRHQSDPARSGLCSGALTELAGFVAAVREVPFAMGCLGGIRAPALARRGRAWRRARRIYVDNKGKVSSQRNSIRAAPRVSLLRSQIAAQCQAMDHTNFSQTPLRHVPRWLPRFPKGWKARPHGHSEAAAKDEEDIREVSTVMANGNGVRRAMPENMEKVSFRLGEKCRRRHVAPPER
ncbi:hypothetical protein BAE44_0024472, partial [Dichanthelium oligosanthes]